MKAHAEITIDAGFPYSGFWRDNWVVSKLVQVLQARGLKAVTGTKLRVIVVPEENQNAVLFQGEEVNFIRDAIHFAIGGHTNHDHPDVIRGQAILAKIDETSTAV